MFQEYKLQTLKSFTNPVIRICVAENGTLLIQTSYSLQISHLKCCAKAIELFSYFRQQLKMTETINCTGLTNVRLQESTVNRSCFGLVANQRFWLIVVNIVSDNQNVIELQFQRVKMFSLSEQQNSLSLRMISTQMKGRVILEQQVKDGLIKKLLNIIQIKSYSYLTGKYGSSKLKKLKLAKANEQQIEKWHQMLRMNLLYQLFQHQKEEKLLIYNQLPSIRTQQHYIFIYDLSDASQDQTSPQQCLILPLFDEDKLLCKILFIPTDQHQTIEQTQLLLFYQTSDGLEIIETQFQAPNIALRKYLYLDLNFINVISSSINSEQIYLKGIENCIENHTILVQTSKHMTQTHYLTLLSMPSTGNPKIINEKQAQQPFKLLKNEKGEILVYSEVSLTCLKMVKKRQLYEALLWTTFRQAHSISSQVLELLE